jgi:hypothetical protein
VIIAAGLCRAHATCRIIALMLGRQRMSAEQARSAYEKLQPQAKIGSGEVFKASKFEEALKSIFKDEKMQDLRANACKTCVIRFCMH